MPPTGCATCCTPVKCGSTPSPPSGRYRPGLLRCDPAVAPLRVSGAFQLHDTDAVLAALPATLPVSVRYRTSYWVTIGPRIAAA